MPISDQTINRTAPPAHDGTAHDGTAPDRTARPDDTLTPAEIAAIAEHEHLTVEEAAARGAVLLDEPHGDAALRQIVWDNLVKARQFHDVGRIAALTALYEETCRRHPSPCDRRLAPTRETHPFVPPAVH